MLGACSLASLCPAVADRQEHRHSFVRKNAVFATWTIFQDHEHLIPDAPELLDTFLAAVGNGCRYHTLNRWKCSRQESDTTCKRNAFVALCSISQSTAVRYLLNNFDSIGGMDELMQMAVIELVRKEAKTEGSNRVCRRLSMSDSTNGIQARWIRVIFELLNSPSHAVKYEAAISLTTLTQNPAAVKGQSAFVVSARADIVAAAGAFAELIVKEADNNVKLIVLGRFDTLRSKHEHVLDGMVMDILKVLSRCVVHVARDLPRLTQF